MPNLRITNAMQSDRVQRFQVGLDQGAGAGTIEIRSGSQPADADDAATGTLLATLTFSDPSAPAASAGVLTLNAITEDSSADNTGTASWARAKDSNGTTIFDCDVTATGGGGTIQLNTVSIVAGGPVRITSFTITDPAAS